MISQEDIDKLAEYWQGSRLFPNISPQQIATMIAAIQPQPFVPQTGHIVLSQSKGRAPRSKPVPQEITCEFKRVEGTDRPFRGMAYRIIPRIPHEMIRATWQAKMWAWCFNQWGASSPNMWRDDQGYFYFKNRQQAMMFKLAWHGTTE